MAVQLAGQLARVRLRGAAGRACRQGRPRRGARIPVSPRPRAASPLLRQGSTRPIKFEGPVPDRSPILQPNGQTLEGSLSAVSAPIFAIE